MTAATIAGHSNKSEYSKKNGYRKSSKTPWGNPIVYFFSLVLVAICITPVLYIIFGGFRTNSQITNHPSGMPNHGPGTTTRRSSKVIFSGRN